MRKTSSSSSVRSLLATAALVLAMQAAPAVACDPVPHPLIPGAFIGCCQLDGTLLPAGTNTASECIRSLDHTCQIGHCNSSGQCAASSQGNYQAVDGNPACINPDNACAVGECRQQNCDAINDGTPAADVYDDFCDSPVRNPGFNTNPCVDNFCTLVNGAADCDYTNKAEHAECSSTSGSTCTVKECLSGVCTATGGSVNCTQPTDTCKVGSCVVVNGSAQCTTAKALSGTDCDTNDNDCKIHKCRSNGACGSSERPVDDPCDSNLLDCKAGRCDNKGACANEVPTSAQNTWPCEDGNFCTSGETCTDGVCGHNTGCLSGNHCLLCGDNTCANTGANSTCGCP